MTTTTILQLNKDELRQELRSVLHEVLAEHAEHTTPAPQDTKEPTNLDTWGTRADACAILKISFPTLHLLMRNGQVQFRKCRRRTLIDLDLLREKLASGELGKPQKSEVL